MFADRPSPLFSNFSKTSHIQLPQARRAKGSSFTSLVTGVLLSFWLLFPSRLRLTVYDLLTALGSLLHGQPDHHAVFRLPFDFYLKRQSDVSLARNEFNALHLLRRHTSVPIPKPLDLAVRKATRSGESDMAYLVTTRIPGIPLWRCQHVFTDTDMDEITAQMTDYLAQLRTIPNNANPSHPICNTLGGAIRDPRVRSEDPMGPFPDEESFHMVLRLGDDPARRGDKIVFTHADLNPRNILAERVVRQDGSQGWRVRGIVDWEHSGFYPEYWDYTKSMFEGFRWTTRYNDMVRRWWGFVGEEGYERELEVERRAWGMGDGI